MNTSLGDFVIESSICCVFRSLGCKQSSQHKIMRRSTSSCVHDPSLSGSLWVGVSFKVPFQDLFGSLASDDILGFVMRLLPSIYGNWRTAAPMDCKRELCPVDQ